MADLTTTIHETIEQHRYAVPAGEMSYRPGDHPDSEGDNVPSLAPALTERDREAEVEQLRQSRDTWERVEAETRAEMHTRLAEHRDAVEVLKLRLSEVAAERDRARSVAVALEAEVERLRAGIEALAAEMQSDTCPSCHVSYADEGSTTWGCDHTEGMQHAGDMLRALLAEGGEG